ncbi:hypothetical protein AB0K15_34450 [Amycolatopsis sp. NPDC049253]|uniref:hypothetical protein n=1 Tax=Amycolatopsis sp. NPDC049253 TaxID=3155274 RepID=UPI00341462AD
MLRAGQPSIGFAEGLRDLGAYEGVFLALGYVDDRPQGGYHFQLFLTPDLSRLVTCWGVKRSARAAAPAERVLDRRRLSGLGLERRSTADQELLLAMLAPPRPAEIPTLVVAALDAGAPCVIEVPVGTLRMRSSYARWQSVAQEAGWPSIGFPEGAGQLDAYDRPLGAFARIDDHPRGGYYFQLFLTPDLSRPITGFGVKAAAERRA